MIYCVNFEVVKADLDSRGFGLVSTTEIHYVFSRGQEVVTLRRPNQMGGLPEMLVNGAYVQAGLDPPAWPVYWCD